MRKHWVLKLIENKVKGEVGQYPCWSQGLEANNAQACFPKVTVAERVVLPNLHSLYCTVTKTK